MSDSFDDGLQGLFDDLDNVTDSAPQQSAPKPSPQGGTGGRKSKTPAYRSALTESKTNRHQTAKVTGKKGTVAGQYMRRSFTFRPDQLDSLDAVAAQLGLSKNDLVRWFIDMGLDAVEQGYLPPVAEEIRHRYDPNG